MLVRFRTTSTTLFRCRFASTLRPHVEDRRWPGWQVVIGIEVHAQLKSRHKLFSESLTSNPGEVPNTYVSPYDAAFPGTLPKLNPKCVDLALRTAIALGSDIHLKSSFDRKHYFYSDLPSGYQITQCYSPIATGGQLELLKGSPNTIVRIKQLQLEQDTAKSTTDTRRQVSLIDLNRAGMGLMEIVSEPDMRSPEEAAEFVRSLQALLRSVGSSDGEMEKGSFRCDVNVSVNRLGEPWGTRCEIKNLNSIKFMTIAIASEVLRQTDILSSSPKKKIEQETRGFNEQRSETFKLRNKEDAPDYRYMPDPNLPLLTITPAHLDKVKQTMPEIPPVTRARLRSQYGLSQRDTEVLLAVDASKEIRFDGELPTGSKVASTNEGAVAFFEALCSGEARLRDPKVVVNWLTHELLGQLAARKETFESCTMTVSQLGQLIDLVTEGVITGTSGKIVLKHMLANPKSNTSPKSLSEQLELTALSASSSSASSNGLEDLCKTAISTLPSEATAMRQGNRNVVNKIVGAVMRESRGRADAQSVKDIIEQLVLGEQK